MRPYSSPARWWRGLEALEPRWLLAGEQIVTPDPLAQGALPGAGVAVEVRYDSDDETLSGLGLRMHFDSGALTFVDLTSVLQTFLGTQQIQDDTSDFDGDPATDKLLLIFWLDPSTLFNPLEGDWPGQGTTPATLFVANFTTAATFSTVTTVNFTASSTAAGKTFGSQSATISPLAPNQTPTVVAAIDDLTVTEDAPAVLDHADLNAVFDDPDHADSQLTYSIIANTGGGIVTAQIGGDDTLDLSFAADQNGAAQITVRATDPAGAAAEDTFNVTVQPDNDDPVVGASISDVLVNVNAPDTTIGLDDRFSDVDVATNNDVLTYSAPGNTNPALVSANVAGDTLTLSYAANQGGESQVTVRATDQAGRFAEQSFSVWVNRPPVTATAPADVVVNEDAADTTINLAPAFDDPDIIPFGDSLGYSVAANTMPSLVAATVSGGTLRLDYADNANGSGSITVRATDDAGASVEQTFAAEVQPVNDPPTPGDPIGNVNADASDPDTIISLAGAFGDVDIATNADSLSYTVAGNTNSNVVSASVQGSALTLGFAPGLAGSADVPVRATDQAGALAEQVVHVSVTAQNTAPVVD